MPNNLLWVFLQNHMACPSDGGAAYFSRKTTGIALKVGGFVQIGVLGAQYQCRNLDVAQGLPRRIGVLKIMSLPVAAIGQFKFIHTLRN